MTPIFIQTLNHVFEVSKIQFIDLKPSGGAIVHYEGKTQVDVVASEIEALLDSIAGLTGPHGILIARRSNHVHNGKKATSKE